MSERYVLWGIKYVPQPIRITAGNARHCNARLAERVREGGWEGLAIRPEGQPYNPSGTAA